MKSTLSILWQHIRRHRRVIISFLVALVLVSVLVIIDVGGYLWNWDWTGLNRYTGPVIQTNQQYRAEKTFWDWLELLFVPIILSALGILFTRLQERYDRQAEARARDDRVAADQRAEMERRAADQRSQTEQEAIVDNQRGAELQEFINKTSELLLDKDLRASDAVQKNARARTLVVLPHLDPDRKRSVLQFLYESGLLQKEGTIVNLQDADLSKAHLRYARLSGADLSGADLSGADLNEAHLNEAHLNEAHLSYADLSKADLYGARLSGADLHGARIDGADLSEADLSEAHLNGACLSKARLRGADLSGADLRGADLSGADLNEADLRGACLSDAHLDGANLRGTDLYGAIVTEAELKEVELTQEQRDQIRSSQAVTTSTERNPEESISSEAASAESATVTT